MMLLCLMVCSVHAQVPEPLPPPPDQPPNEAEAVEITPRVVARTSSCDHAGPDGATEDGPLRWTWTDGVLRVLGRVMHNGVEHVDADAIRAWKAGDKVSIAYRVDSPDQSPFDLFVACPGYTHLDVRIDGIARRPQKVTVYISRLEYDAGKAVPNEAR